MTKWDSTWQMESDTSAEIITQSADIQQEKDTCKELMFEKGLGVTVGRKLGMSLQYDMTNN